MAIYEGVSEGLLYLCGVVCHVVASSTEPAAAALVLRMAAATACRDGCPCLGSVLPLRATPLLWASSHRGEWEMPAF